jgi:adenine-specific DNA-methyltransferase
MGDHGGGASGSQYHGRLELTWTNKDQALLWSEDGSYGWVSPADYRVAEVRLLHEAGEVGQVGPVSRRAADNLLIRGDALNALTSLARIPEFQREYLGKVKVAYLDPPFNTQQAFEHYDDALEHSVWLTMMRDRLVQIKRLLREDGSVWVHLDDAEMPYCKIVMDEVFGRENFITVVIWQKTTSGRNDAQFFSTDHDYILVYARQRATLKLNRLSSIDSDATAYKNPDNDPRGRWREIDYKGPKSADERPNLYYAIKHPRTGEEVWPRRERVWAYGKDEHERHIREGLLWWGRTGNYRLPKLKRFLGDGIAPLVPRTLWTEAEADTSRRAKDESKRLFPNTAPFSTPKPEKLLGRILTIGSTEGDIVLDCFLGSGTTAAVAHKMGRRWVGVERSADTLATYAVPRLEKVVAGDDPGGITSAVGWAGGAGFRILDVSPSMFVESRGSVVLAEWAVNGRLAEATAAQLGYEFRFDPPFCGFKGRSLLAVVDGLITSEVVELISASLEPNERAVVCGTAIAVDADAALKAVSPGSRVRRIPASILADYRLATRRFFHRRDVAAVQPNLNPNRSPIEAARS